MSLRGFDAFNTAKSFEDFAKSIGADSPTDHTFGDKCINLFKKQGKDDEECKTLCYGVAQSKYKKLRDQESLDDIPVQEDNKFYTTSRSEERRSITRNSMNGLSPSGNRKKRRDAGRGREGEYELGTSRSNTHGDCVEREISRGREPNSAKNICNKITFGIKDRIKNGVAGKLPKFISTMDIEELNDYKDDVDYKITELDVKDNLSPKEQKQLNLLKIKKEMIEIMQRKHELKNNVDKESSKNEIISLERQYDDKYNEYKLLQHGQNESFYSNIDDIFDGINFLEEKKKKKKKRKSKRYRGGFGGYYNDSESSDGGDGGGGE